jgi:hypothetical protein
MKKKIAIIILLGFVFTFTMLSEDLSIIKAQRVNKILNKISKGRHLRLKSIVMKEVSFTQEEFNSYMNKIYLPKFFPEAKELNIEFFSDNIMKVQVKVEMKGEKYKKIPSLFKKFELETEGTIFSKKYQMRYEFKTLKINGTSFSPDLLDEAASTFQSGYKVKKSLFDWFQLLPGIKKVSAAYKKITFYY